LNGTSNTVYDYCSERLVVTKASDFIIATPLSVTVYIFFATHQFFYIRTDRHYSSPVCSSSR